MLEVKKSYKYKKLSQKLVKKEDVRETSSCWMVLLLMVEEEVRRVWMMLSLLGVAAEVYDSAVAYWWVLGQHKVRTVRCCKKCYQTWCKNVQLSDQSCVCWWSVELCWTMLLLAGSVSVKLRRCS